MLLVEFELDFFVAIIKGLVSNENCINLTVVLYYTQAFLLLDFYTHLFTLSLPSTDDQIVSQLG